MSARVSHRLAAVLLASTALVGAAVPAATAAPAALPNPGDAALDWIEGELVADGGALTSSFDDGQGGIGSFVDYGLTIDAILALAADGRGDEEAATVADGLVEDALASYITAGDFGFPDERFAGATAKAMLMALVQGADPGAFGGFDLEQELRGLLTASGPDAGRFSDLVDPDNEFGGDFSNGFSQALAIIALARTDGGVPASGISFLLAQQCPGGGFRGNYTTTGGCTADSAATVDATGFALQALVTVAPTCATRQAVTDAVASLVAGQNAGGAFGGESGSNANSTGLAAVALRSLGESNSADAAAAFIAGLQLDAGDDVGAVALNAAGLASAGDGIQILERDGFRRASTQGALAFGLPTYGEIGTDAVDPADFEPCARPPEPGKPTATLSASTVAPGGTLTVEGTGFTPGEPVVATLHSTPIELGTVTADADGVATLAFTVPADLEPGDHRVELVGQRSGVVVSVAFEVLGVDAPGALPATGRMTDTQAGTGVGLLVLGATLVALARRRRAACV